MSASSLCTGWVTLPKEETPDGPVLKATRRSPIIGPDTLPLQTAGALLHQTTLRRVAPRVESPTPRHTPTHKGLLWLVWLLWWWLLLWLLLVVVGCGWLWLVVVGCGWLLLVVVGCCLLLLVVVLLLCSSCCCCFGVCLEQCVCPHLQVLIVQRATQPLRLIELITCVMSSYLPSSPNLTESPSKTQPTTCTTGTANVAVFSTDDPRHLSWTQQACQQPCPGTAPVEARRPLATSTYQQDLWHWHTTICSPAVGTS